MFSHSKAAMERAMKVQEAILRAMAKCITSLQAAESAKCWYREKKCCVPKTEQIAVDHVPK